MTNCRRRFNFGSSGGGDNPPPWPIALALLVVACGDAHPRNVSFGSLVDVDQMNDVCSIQRLASEVAFVSGLDPISKAEAQKPLIEEALPSCLFARGADMAACTALGYVACEPCGDSNCLLCTSTGSLQHYLLYWPVCEATPCSYEQMTVLVSAADDECALRLSWDSLPPKAKLWLNQEALGTEVCANRALSRFSIGGCNSKVKIRQIAVNQNATSDRGIYVCTYPPDADVWSAAFPYRHCTGSSWGFDSDVAASHKYYDPTRSDVVRYAGSLCVLVDTSHGARSWWTPETSAELAGLRTDGCDLK